MTNEPSAGRTISRETYGWDMTTTPGLTIYPDFNETDSFTVDTSDTTESQKGKS